MAVPKPETVRDPHTLALEPKGPTMDGSRCPIQWMAGPTIHKFEATTNAETPNSTCFLWVRATFFRVTETSVGGLFIHNAQGWVVFSEAMRIIDRTDPTTNGMGWYIPFKGGTHRPQVAKPQQIITPINSLSWWRLHFLGSHKFGRVDYHTCARKKVGRGGGLGFEAMRIIHPRWPHHTWHGMLEETHHPQNLSHEKIAKHVPHFCEDG